MLNLCPQCRSRFEDFAVTCVTCGWSLLDAQGQAHHSQKRTTEDHASGRTVGAAENAPFDAIWQDVIKSVKQQHFASAIEQLGKLALSAPDHRQAACLAMRGYCYLKLNDFVQAETDCSDALRHDYCDGQTYRQTHAWRAEARSGQNRWKEAFDDLDEACSIAGDRRDVYLELMEAYAFTAGEYFEQQINSGRQSADLFFERGWVCYRFGKKEQAKRDFFRAMQLEPGHPWAAVGLVKLMCGDGRLLARLRRARRRHKRNQETGKLDAIVIRAIRLCGLGLKEHASPECQWEARKSRARLYRDFGIVSRANRDLRKLTRLAQQDDEKIIECCELRFQLADYMDAVTELTEVLKVRPSYQRAILLRGKCYAKVRSYPLAIDDLLAYLQLNPADTLARAGLAQVYLTIGQIEFAAQEFENVTRYTHGSFEAYLGLSQIFLAKGRLDFALAQCERAIAIDSRRSEAFSTQAEIYLKLGDCVRALDSYGRAVRIATDVHTKANYLYLRGAAFFELERYEDAQRDFRRSCRLRPNHAGAWVWNSAACARLEKWSEANDSLAMAMTVRPDAAPQYQQLGQGIAKKSVKYFTHQIRRGNDGRRMYRDRAVAYQFLNRYASAIEDLTTALDRDRSDLGLLIQRGQVYALTGDHESAQDDFTNAIRLDRLNHWARFYRAQSRLAQNQTERAQRDVQKAIRISSIQPQYHKLLAEIYIQQNRPEEVIKCLSRAILLDATDTVCYRKRGDAEFNLKHWLAAVNDYSRAMELEPGQTDLLLLRAQAYVKAEKHRSAILDFEATLVRNRTIPKAYAGRALALTALGTHDYALLWLTKAFHRFSQPRDLCEIVFARGKINYRASRFPAASSDFTAVARLMKNDDQIVAAAKYARGVARVQMQQLELAYRDFKNVVGLEPGNLAAQIAIAWLVNPSKTPLPPFLEPPEPVKRPVRPPVVRQAVKMTTREKDWRAERPFNCWIVRTLDKEEFGPVDRAILNQWIEEGRIDFGMRVLRADWPRWKRVELVFNELLPAGAEDRDDSSSCLSFPDLDLSIRKPPASPS